MNKDDKYIIPPEDPRYKLLESIFDKYSWDNVVRINLTSSIYYFIPPELVLEEYSDYSRSVSKSPSDDWENWIYRRRITEICKLTTGLSMQEWFDLLIYHNNEINKRPRCTQCGVPLQFISPSYGYSKGRWDKHDHIHLFCSQSCAGKFIMSHPEIYPNTTTVIDNFIKSGFSDPMVNIKAQAESYLVLNKETYSKIHFYAALTSDGRFKFGITCGIIGRQYMANYKTIHSLIFGNIEEMVYLEARMKLRYQGSEYLNLNEIGKFFKDLRLELKNSPITSPF